MPEENTNQPIDLSELANLQFSTAWSPSTNYSGFEDRKPARGGFKKRGEFDAKKRDFKREKSSKFENEERKGRKFNSDKKSDKKFDRRDNKKPAKKAPFVFSMEVLFYPEDAPFAKLADVMKHLKRTYQLFDIAELVLEKPERFIILAKNLPLEDGTVKPLYCAQPANIPFEDEESAKKFALECRLNEMFEQVEVEAEAPKGSFQVVNRCSISGDLLGAPNWHKYGEYVREYHAQKFAKMPYEKFLASVETVRDEALVAQWLEQMKKRLVYKLKDSETTFETREAAMNYIAEQKSGELVKSYEQVRMHGSDIAKLPFGSRIRRNLEAAWSKQKHFPIVTANNLRGRLRRGGFTIYKRGSKGFAFVCAVKRKFLLVGDSLSDTPQKIYDFLMENQGVKASALPYLYLGLQAPQDVSKAATLAEEHKKEAEGGAVSDPVSIVENAEISAEDFAKIKEVSNDLLWLISEGYVVEYADGALQANPRLPRPKDKGAKTIASDAESIVLGVEDEPIVSPKVAEETEECDAHEESSDNSEEENKSE
ncbi:hypothetical protein [Intestinicryptomonas porci]|uniref:Uncharacterized protein n=1 Tax=Intestinicryptomonas porci TaxID=2926320 RepID=A0ABU4WFE1_9BACT|nr:hypothetical protein [Opitutales bacterium CLA-KB-P66]